MPRRSILLKRIGINSLLCALVFVLVPSQVASSDSTTSASTIAPLGFNWKWLNQLLSNATFKFPDTEFPLGLGVKGAIKNFECDHIAVASDGGIGFNVTQEVPPSLLELEIHGVGAACKGDWALILGEEEDLPLLEDVEESMPTGGHKKPRRTDRSKPMILRGSDTNTVAVVVNKTGAMANLNMEYTADGLWSTSTVQKCSVDVGEIDITINGGILEKFINLFKKQIAAFIKTEVNSKLCATVDQLVAVNLTQDLKWMDTKVEALMNPPPPPPLPKVAPGSFIWSKNRFIKLVDDTVHVLTPSLLDTLLDAVTKGTGILNVSIPMPGLFTINTTVANLTFGLNGFAVTGIDTLEQLEVLQPDTQESPYSLETKIDFAKFKPELDLSVKLASNVVPGEVINRNFSMSFGLTNVSLHNRLFLALKEEPFWALDLDQYKNPACLLGAVDAGNVTSLELTYSTLETLTVRGWDDFDPIFDALMLDVYKIFEKAAHGIIAGIGNGPIANLTNNYIAAQIKNASACPARPPPPAVPSSLPGMVNWKESEVFGALTRALAESVGIPNGFPGMNSLVDLLTGGSGSLDLKLHVSKSFPAGILGNVTIGVTGLALGGLNSFTHVSLLEAASSLEIETALGLGDLTLNLTGFADLGSLGKKDIRLSMELAKVSVAGRLFLALPIANHLVALRPEQWTNATCIFANVEALNVTGLAVNYSITSVAATGWDLLDSVFGDATGLVTALLPEVLDGGVGYSIQTLLNNASAGMVKASRGACPPVPYPASSCEAGWGCTDWEDSPAISLLELVVNETIGMNDTHRGALSPNLVADILTNGTGNISIPDFLLPSGSVLTPFGNLTYRIEGIHVSGLNSFQGLAAMVPIGGNKLQSSFSLKQIGVDLVVDIRLGNYKGSKLALNLSLSEFEAGLILALGVPEGEWQKWGGEQWKSLNCWIAAAKVANVTDLGLNYTLNGITLVSTGGVDPKLDPALHDAVDLLMLLVPDALAGNSGVVAAIKDKINANIDLLLEAASSDCPAFPGPPGPVVVPGGMIDLEKDKIVTGVVKGIREAFGTDGGDDGINKWVSQATP